VGREVSKKERFLGGKGVEKGTVQERKKKVIEERRVFWGRKVIRRGEGCREK
ncbi:6943_t:CDS:1, partial [Gigaspora margarita]